MFLKQIILYLAGFRVVPILYASIKAAFSKYRLPPGDFIIINTVEPADRKFLLDHSRKVGAIFKSIDGRRFCVCVVGLSLCRQFLQEHSANVTPQTVDMKPLFPKGFLRQMKGEDHKVYRKSLMQAIDSEVVERDGVQLEEIVSDGFARYVANQKGKAGLPDDYLKTLNDIASGLLVYIFFGARFGTESYETLLRLYNNLGPGGLEWWIGEKQKNAFNVIRDYLLERLREQNESVDGQSIRQSIIGRMHTEKALDETSLGNLIYMVEMGRFDMYSLFRWLSKYAAENPDLLNLVSCENREDMNDEVMLSDAFVLETLRLNQIERLMRTIDRDICFEGYLIPKHATIRLCLWESHKSADSFPDPFAFNPQRFMDRRVTKDEFSPFGLDHHSCPFADISLKMSSVFIKTLAKLYTLEAVGNGPTVKGRYHWQPATRFSVQLKDR